MILFLLSKLSWQKDKLLVKSNQRCIEIDNLSQLSKCNHDLADDYYVLKKHCHEFENIVCKIVIQMWMSRVLLAFFDLTKQLKTEGCCESWTRIDSQKLKWDKSTKPNQAMPSRIEPNRTESYENKRTNDMTTARSATRHVVNNEWKTLLELRLCVWFAFFNK